MAHKTTHTLCRLFTKTKDRIDKFDISNIVYKIPCRGNDSESCNMVYVGTTKINLGLELQDTNRIRNIDISQHKKPH